MTLWQRLSARERRLFLGALIAAIVFLAALFIYQARARLQDLDEQIADAQDELVDLTARVAESAAVEKAFAEIAAEHSSGWTKVEIHDRLRREIYRLALKTPPPPGVDAATAGASAGEKLVDILSLGEGQLSESGKGYREYQISFDVQPNSIQNIVTFVRRLMESPQTLRVEQIDLKREPANARVQASFTITRTVVDGIPGETGGQQPSAPAAPEGSAAQPAGSAGATPAAPSPESARNGGFETFDAIAGTFTEWTAEEGRAVPATDRCVEGKQSARFEASANGATFWQGQTLEPGAQYDLSLAVWANGKTVLGVGDAATGAVLNGAETQVTLDDKVHVYRIRFTAPAGSVRAPFVRVDAAGAAVQIDAVSLKRVGGSA